MASSLVRGVDDAIVRAPEERAGEHGQSAEAEHRAIPAEAWAQPLVPQPGPGLDKQIAAIAQVNSLTFVTRNTAYFAGTGVNLLNPFVTA